MCVCAYVGYLFFFSLVPHKLIYELAERSNNVYRKFIIRINETKRSNKTAKQHQSMHHTIDLHTLAHTLMDFLCDFFSLLSVFLLSWVSFLFLFFLFLNWRFIYLFFRFSILSHFPLHFYYFSGYFS